MFCNILSCSMLLLSLFPCVSPQLSACPSNILLDYLPLKLGDIANPHPSLKLQCLYVPKCRDTIYFRTVSSISAEFGSLCFTSWQGGQWWLFLHLVTLHTWFLCESSEISFCDSSNRCKIVQIIYLFVDRKSLFVLHVSMYVHRAGRTHSLKLD